MEHQADTNTPAPAENKTGLAALWAYVKKGWSWIWGTKPESIDEKNIPTASGPIKELLDSMRAEIDEYKKYLSLPGVEASFMHSAVFMMEAGISDGVYGNRAARQNEVNVLAQSRAQKLCDLANAALKGNLAKAITEGDAAEKLMKRNKKNDDEQHRDLEKQLYYQRDHSRSYNWIWGALCFAAACGLAWADYPLSLKLLADGFDFPASDYYPTALGLVLCTFFIKIFFDNYIDVKYGHGLVAEKDFYDMYAPHPGIHENGPDQEEKDKNKKELRNKRIWYTAIFIFTIGGIVVLAFFRSDALINKWNGSTSLRTATFLFLTIIFPVISGICLSVSLTVFENCGRFARTKKRCKKTTEDFIQSHTLYTGLKKEREDIENELNKWSHNGAVVTYTSILLAYYDNGYKRGSYEPDIAERHLDFFERVESWRDRIVTRKSNIQIIKSSGL